MAGATLTSTTTFSDVMKTVYEPVMRDQSVIESEMWDLFTEEENFDVTEGPDGKSINLAHVFSYGGGVTFASENDYIPASQDPNIKQSSINIGIMMCVVEMSGKVMRRIKEGPAAYDDWARRVLPERVRKAAFHKDRALIGTGTGVLFQLNGTPGGASGIAINNAFGVSGLSTATYNVWMGDSLRFAADAGGVSLRTGPAVTQNVHFGANTIDVDALPAASAAGDFVALGDLNQNAFGKEPMGLLGIVDDGTNVATFQNLSRTTYPLMQGQIVNAATANGSIYGGLLSEDLIEYADRIAYERGLGKPDVLVTSRSGRASFWKDMKSDRRISDATGAVAYTGGFKPGGLRVSAGGQEYELKVCRKMPTSLAFLIQKDTLRMFRVGPGRWDDTTGSIWRQSIDTTGRKDAYFALYIEEFNVGSSAPSKNVQINGLTA